jgi:hypothetical protein
MKRPFIVFSLSMVIAASGDESQVAYVELTPPPPPAEESDPKAKPAPQPRTTLWSIGEPTGQEQLYLELINRARANPTAEGVRLASLTDPAITQAYSYFGVNLDRMKAEMANTYGADPTYKILPAWPLAMNAKLLTSARGHSNWMFANGQSHTGSGGSTILQRATAQGYSAQNIAENIFTTANSTEHGHASFLVDWGFGSYGMQDGRLHRRIAHGGYREVGIGIKEGSNGTTAGPQVVTQDFAIAAGPVTPFVTGVAYYDFNRNNFYDPGEGLGGIQVTVAGAAYHSVTAASGGYAIPVPAGDATRAVTFSGNGFTHTTSVWMRADNWSEKVDYIPAYEPPALSGPSAPVLSAPTNYAVDPVAGAATHEWRYMRRTPAATDGANNTSLVTSTMSTPLSSSVKQEGTSSYRLNHASKPAETVTFLHARVAGSAPVLRYYSRLAYALTSQKAYVQASTDNGQTWITLETQTGSGGNGQSTFSQRTVSLAPVAGSEFRLRFHYAVAGSPYSNGSSDSTGWYIDNISFTDVLDTSAAVTAAVPTSNTVAFTPPGTGEWLLSARPIVAGRTLAFGPNLSVNAIPPATSGYAAWAASHESAAGLPSGTLSATGNADYNKDSVPNLIAYALGLSPTQPAAHLLPQPARSGSHIILQYTKDTAKTDITLTAEATLSPSSWFAPGHAGAPAGFTDTLLNTSGTVQTRRAMLPVTTGQKGLLRLKVTRP